VIGPLGDSEVARRGEAETRLARMLELYELGHRSPLALPPETGLAWQQGIGRSRNSALWSSRKKFETERFNPEREDSSLRLLFPGVTTVEAMLELGFDEQASALWQPVLEVCSERKL
jgi:exonuclease V gamma subunit